MPFYSFQCPNCKTTFTLMRAMDRRDDETECPSCGGEQSVRLLSIPLVMSRSESGYVSSLSGSGCGGCSASSCAGCRSS